MTFPKLKTVSFPEAKSLAWKVVIGLQEVDGLKIKHFEISYNIATIDFEIPSNWPIFVFEQQKNCEKNGISGTHIQT